MLKNPGKRVTDVAVGKSERDFWILFEINRAEAMYVETSGLTILQVKILSDGYVHGFACGECLAPELIEVLLNDPTEIAALPIPLNVSPPDRELFRRGTAGGLKLAASGFWLDRPTTPSGAAVIVSELGRDGDHYDGRRHEPLANAA